MISAIIATGLFSTTQSSEASRSIFELMLAGKWSKKSLLATTRSSGDQEVDAAVMAKTMQEVHDGKACGPFSFEEVEAQPNGLWAPVRRFGVRQGDDVRPIDDFLNLATIAHPPPQRRSTSAASTLLLPC